MPDGELSETVSREAHDRIKRERDELKAEKTQFESASQQFLLTDQAYEHFRSKGVTDPYAAAKAASRDSMFVGVDRETLPDKLDSWLDDFKAVFGAPAPSGDDGTEAGSTTPPTPPPPGAARPAPSPANSGGDPKPEPMTMKHPDVQRLIREGRRDEVKEMVKDGRVQLSANNPYTPGIQAQ